MTRFTLLPGLRRLWRDHRTLQFGVDPQSAVTVEFTDPRTARLLDLLDGSRTDQSIVAAAAERGISDAETYELIDLLRREGLVIGTHTLLPAGLAEPTRRRLASEAAALAMRQRRRRGRTPAEILRRRGRAHVLVTGSSRLAVPIAAALAVAGVHHVDPAVHGLVNDSDPALCGLLPSDLRRRRAAAAIEAVGRVAPETDTRPLRSGSATFVVQVGSRQPPVLEALAFRQRDLPHLSVSIRDGVIVVGPLVPPQGTPCLNCLDLHRRDRDPAWPALVAQLSTSDADEPCESTTALVGVGFATAEVLEYLDGASPQTIGATVEIPSAGHVRRRSWASHPGCDCRRSAKQKHDVIQPGDDHTTGQVTITR